MYESVCESLYVWLLATHSSILAWRIPGTGEPGGLPSMGSHRVGNDWSDLAAAAACYQIYTYTIDNIKIFIHLYIYQPASACRHHLLVLILVFLFLHIHPWVCMFLVNPLPCRGHALTGRWCCESLVNSGVMKPPMWSLCDLCLPSASAHSGNRLLQIPQEGVKPLVGTVGFRTGVSSLWPVPLSFNELMPISKDSRTFPGDSQLRDPAQPHSSGGHALNITQRASCRRGRHTLLQIGVDRFSFWVIFKHKGRFLLCPRHR